MYRNSYIEVNLDAIERNANFFAEKTGKKVIGVVKANGYATVDYMEITALKSAGIDFFAVSSLDEALNLRKHEVKDNILILGYVPASAMSIVKNNDLSIVTVSKEFVEEADLEGVKVHLKIDTGMNRIGIKPDQAKEVLDLLISKYANVEGIMSHFSSADFDKEYSIRQYKLFEECVKNVGYEFKYIHMSATDASLLIDCDICNYCRVGLGLLGYSAYETDLEHALSLYSEVIMCKQIDEGETVSYGRHYTSDGKGYILTIPLGYADGFYRSNTNKKVFVENEYGRIVGSICMDQLMILTEHPHAPGSKVELFGTHIDITKRAQELGTITYELITGLSERLTRIYKKNNEVIKRIDPRF